MHCIVSSMIADILYDYALNCVSSSIIMGILNDYALYCVEGNRGHTMHCVALSSKIAGANYPTMLCIVSRIIAGILCPVLCRR